MQDLVRVVVAATVGLQGLGLCAGGGLLALAAFPLTHDRHVETLRSPMGPGGRSEGGV